MLTCLWSSTVPAAGAPPTLVLPDGCADLIWRTNGEAFIAGPDTGPVVSRLPPGTVLVGARFGPETAGAEFGIGLDELRDQRVSLAAVMPRVACQLRGVRQPAAAVKELTEIAGQLAITRPPDPLVREAARRLADPRVRVEALAGQLGLSDRQLRRRCQAAAGYGPKTLQRVLRFRRFVARVDGGARDLARIAQEAGYADQAHLTRECAQLAGLSPTVLARARTVS